MNCVSTNMKMFISKREIHICTCSSSFLSKRQSCSRETSSLLLPATSVSLLNLTAAQAPSTCKTPTVACVYQVYSYNNVRVYQVCTYNNAHVSIKSVHTNMYRHPCPPHLVLSNSSWVVNLSLAFLWFSLPVWFYKSLISFKMTKIFYVYIFLFLSTLYFQPCLCCWLF